MMDLEPDLDLDLDLDCLVSSAHGIVMLGGNSGHILAWDTQVFILILILILTIF